MSWRTSWARLLGFGRGRWLRDHDLEEEMRSHLEHQVEENLAAGMSPQEARRAARTAFGNVGVATEDSSAMWTLPRLESVLADVRFGWRMLWKSPGFTAVAVLTLALGIGANTAIFSFMDSILLRPLPVPDPQSLALLSWHTPRPDFHGSDQHNDNYSDSHGGYVGGIFSYPAFEMLQKNGAVFSSVFGYQRAGRLNLTFRGEAALAGTEYVSGEYFRGLGAQPAAGRLLTPEDDRAGAPPVAVISHALSERRFGGPANAPGQSILINNLPFTVAGVTQPGFYGADPDMPPDLYVPMHANLLLEAGDEYYPPAKTYLDPNYDWIVPMARLRPGVTIAQAQASLATPFFEWGRAAKPELQPQDVPRLLVREGAGGLDSLRRQYSKPLSILLALVGLILAIACANTASLLLARAAARKREIAVRVSLGAGRWRVVRQLLTESVLLALVSGALGVAFAIWGIQFLTWLLANGQENFTLRADLNWRVLGVVAALSLLTGMLFGLAPALQAAQVELLPALKQSRTGDVRLRRFAGLGLGRVLVVSQIAITLLILVAAGLFLRTLSNLASVPLGFDRHSVLTFQLNARLAGHKDPEIVAFYQELQRRFSAIPGVRAASLSNHVLIGTGTSATGVGVAGGEVKGSRILTIGTGFFQTMQIPILQGRDLDQRDQPGAPMVAIVNQTFARMSFGDRDPLGQRLSLPRRCPKCDIEVVGVSADSVYGNLKKEAPPIVYLPFAQGAWGPVQAMYYELRTIGDPLGYVSAARDIVRQADGRVPLSEVKTQSAWIDQTIHQELALARLCSIFALLALAMASVGLYGTMSYGVARRTSEIGIRMALGAQRQSVVWMVLREVCILAAAGLAISLPTALAVSKVVESFLFGMKPNDPLALAGATAILVSAALLAAYVPARRASQIDPLSALRHE